MAMTYKIITWTEPVALPDGTLLPSSWQARLQQHKRPAKRAQATMAYGLLAELVEAHLGALPDLAVGDDGKPYFPGVPLYFNISHTERAAMAAVSDHPVGVDVEKMRAVSAHMMARVGQTDDVEMFFETWVQKEAMGKCTGQGITITGQVTPSPEVTVTLVEAPVGYRAAVAEHLTNNEK